ncbi:GNAT family N-acetyltransferase [uncultured Litoreibacter sp.]|uniref:GNAT family N-acetyltransferase n=1 Tax=uncultured Litoreibacter sp. TaxID=1392394 RepID=UPI002609AE26|nr:GNAT family N-acetyltransferase [uncultured Litoreibacter sp.]
MLQTPIRLSRGRYTARFACGAADLAAAQGLRHRVFRGGEGVDRDAYDASCDHVLVEDAETGALVCCFRMMTLASGDEISRSYAAQFYDLAGLSGFQGAMAEVGRFCVSPRALDPDILRVAWGAVTAHVDAHGVGLLFGCSSFEGTAADRHLDALSLLNDRHLGPDPWRPKVKAGEVVAFVDVVTSGASDLRLGVKGLPPLLRTYLAMGGWVSDHAVVDRDLGTLHVFTGVEIAAIPPARAKALRAVAG